jgi:hypothetical protein
VLLVPADAVPLDQIDEVARRVAGQGGAAVVGVRGVEIRRPGVEVGEVAAASAGDADLLGDLLGVVDQEHPQSELAGPGGAEQAGGAGADDHRVEGGRHV